MAIPPAAADVNLNNEGGEAPAPVQNQQQPVVGINMGQICGSIEPYITNSSESITEYLERLEFAFAAHGVVQNDQKKSCLLTVVGKDTFHLVKNLAEPVPLTNKTYDEVKTLLTDHLSPTPNVIVERFNFYKRDRKEGESVAVYTAELRKLTRHCNFGANLNEQLRDKLVCGMNNLQIQKKLLAEENLTLDGAYRMCLSMETASKQALELGAKPNQDNVSEINQVNEQRNQNVSMCLGCGGKHKMADCRFRNESCRYCKEKGHIVKMCPKVREKDRKKAEKDGRGNKSGRDSKKINSVDTENPETYDTLKVNVITAGLQSEDNLTYDIFRTELHKDEPIMTKLVVNDKTVSFEVDTGAAITIAGIEKLKCLGKLKMSDTDILLKMANQSIEKPLGVVVVKVNKDDESDEKIQLPIVVTKGNGPVLLGRNWLNRVRLNWRRIFETNAIGAVSARTGHSQLDKELDNAREVFDSKLGLMKDFQVDIKLKQDAVPKFYRARPVPYVLKPAIEAELEKLVNQGVFKQVSTSAWAAPIVPVRKPDGSVRICGDFQLTVNQAAEYENYPVPKTEDLLATLNGGEKFTKLDLSQAYQQLELKEEARELLTINTHKGLFQPLRLQFGLHSASGIFQREMEKRLSGLVHTIVRVDDILITGRNDEEHVKNVAAVLKVVKENGLKLKRSKCVFMADSVEYLGFLIDKSGVSVLEDKIKPILEAPEPENTSQVRSFLGMIQYYHRHLPGLSTLLEPLHELLRKNSKWHWGVEQVKAFNLAKKRLAGAELLVHYNPELPIRLAVDASAYGVGAVLSHVMPDNTEKPVAYASRSLNTAEKNYAPTEREGLAVIFGVKKFHQYLYGLHFTIQTDHKPLLGILGHDKSISALAAARLQRWALILTGYQYNLEYKFGKDHANADAMSRLPLNTKSNTAGSAVENEVFMVELDRAPVTAKEIRTGTDKDAVLSQVRDFVKFQWPEELEVSEVMRPFKIREAELTLENEVVMWGGRVVVPEKLRKKVLEELHMAHTGMSRMKMLARAYCWWPGMDKEIEEMVKSCEICVQCASKPSKVQVHPWEKASRPWSRVHLDHAGPFLGSTFLLVADAYTKWIDAYTVTSTSAGQTIEKLRQSFSIQGIPDLLVTDNGSGFVSQEFKNFTKVNGIKHLTTAPYQPASNGLAERAVQTFKVMLKKIKLGKSESINTQVSRLLFSYRNTPNTVTGMSPSEMLFKVKPRTRLEEIKPNVNRLLEKSTDKMMQKNLQLRTFAVGESVWALSYRGGEKWLKGRIVEKLGDVMYRVQIAGGHIKRHANQLNLRQDDEFQEEDNLCDELITPNQSDQRNFPAVENPEVEPTATMSEVNTVPEPAVADAPVPQLPMTPSSSPSSQQTTVRRSERVNKGKAPGYLSAYQH